MLSELMPLVLELVVLVLILHLTLLCHVKVEDWVYPR